MPDSVFLQGQEKSWNVESWENKSYRTDFSKFAPFFADIRKFEYKDGHRKSHGIFFLCVWLCAKYI